MLHALLALPLLLSGAESARIQAATTISIGAGDFPAVYLNLDIGPLPGGKAPVVDFANFTGSVASVQWHLADNDTAGVAKTANVLVPCGAKTCWVPDTVEDLGSSGRIPVAGRVTNSGMTVCPLVKCSVLDSATAFQNAVSRVRSSGTVVIAGQSPVLTLVAVSPWKRTDGTENHPEVAIPSPGNVGNWISVKTVPFAVDSVVRWMLSSSPGPGCPSCRWDIPYGPVDYQYQIASDPWRADTIRAGESFVADSVLKMGPRLHLAGLVNRSCFAPAVDSQLLQQDQWLLASFGLSTDSVASAFAWGGMCAQARRGAWPYRAGNVEIVPGTWVPLGQIVDAIDGGVGVRRSPSRSGPGLLRTGRQVRLNLPVPALVRVVDLRGVELLPACVYPAGSSVLPMGSNAGMAFVQVRTGLSTVTLPLEPMR